MVRVGAVVDPAVVMGGIVVVEVASAVVEVVVVKHGLQGSQQAPQHTS